MRTKKVLAVLALIAAAAWSVPTGASGADDQRDQVCDAPTETVTLYASKIGPGKIGYGTTTDSAGIPGPTIEMTEGDCLAIELHNTTDRRVSFHPHGVDYTVASDGTRLNKSCVKPGGERTYFIDAHAPAVRTDGTVMAGSAGYWHYHDHCQGSSHGTGGVARGLYGALVVRRPGDPVPDEQFVLVMNQISFNNTVAPQTPVLQANQGERVEFIVIGHGDLFHTFHLHGHRWADTRTGWLADPTTDPSRIIDNKTVGPADSFGFQVVAGEGVGPGAWMYHCHVQGHSDRGMAGLFIVATPDGIVTRAAAKALEDFHGGHH